MRFRIIGLCALAMLAAACTQAVRAQVKTVVAIFGGEARTPAYQTYDHVFLQVMGAASPGGLQYHPEYLDNARFPGPEHERRFAEHLRDRYAGKQVDLVVAVDAGALQFLIKHRAHIYPGVPVVFIGVRALTLDRLELPPDFIGVPLHLEPAPTIRMALGLRPNTRELVFITGASDLDRSWESAIRATPLSSRVNLRVLTGLPIEAIEREVATLGPDAVVVTASFRRDGAGQTFPGSLVLLDRLKRITTAPIFHLYDTGVGRGAVGSFSTPQEAIAAQGAGIAKQLLEGTPVASVALPPPAPPVPIADWRELRRWGMDEARLPPGTVVRFREAGFWEQYRYHALAVAVLVLLETALVAGLLLQRRQRRRVEVQLRQSEQTMHLAASAAQLVMWNWDIARDEIWVSDSHHHQTAGVTPPGDRALSRFLEYIHEEDREAVQRAVRRAIDGDGIYESEYRVVGADGVTRWFAGRGRVEYVNAAPRLLRGVTLDITLRKDAELDAQQQRNELAHLSRVTMLGELSGSMAHELNQPLMAILSNAQAAQMFLTGKTIDLAELGAILDDIVENDKRAGEIIWGLRKMLKKEDADRELLCVNDLVQGVLRLLRSELVNRGIAVEARLADDTPMILGDRMQLQQVVLNLILNACDAMAANPKGERVLAVRTENAGAGVRVSVADRGSGIPPESLKGIFTPFFTTKKHGLGLGLSVCNSIVSSHGGELRAANNADRGATFTFVLRTEMEAVA